MKTMTLLGLPLVLSMLSACGNMTYVHDLTTTPNGARVDVVGAEYHKDFLFGTIEVVTAKRWICLRNAQGRIACQRDESALPMAE